MSTHDPERYLLARRHGFVIGIDNRTVELYTGGTPSMELISTWQIPGARLMLDDRGRVFRVCMPTDLDRHFDDIDSVVTHLRYLAAGTASDASRRDILESVTIELFVHEDDPAHDALRGLDEAMSELHL